MELVTGMRNPADQDRIPPGTAQVASAEPASSGSRTIKRSFKRIGAFRLEKIMPLRFRDAAWLAAGAVLGCSGWALAQGGGELLGPAVFDWNAMAVTRTDTGEVRPIVRRPTATLRELEMHVTTLNPGLASHPPHKHPNEELVIIDQGTVETLSNGEWHRIGPGSIIFNASNSPHALRNVSAAPARYHVVNWSTVATPAE